MEYSIWTYLFVLDSGNVFGNFKIPAFFILFGICGLDFYSISGKIKNINITGTICVILFLLKYLLICSLWLLKFSFPQKVFMLFLGNILRFLIQRHPKMPEEFCADYIIPPARFFKRKFVSLLYCCLPNNNYITL